MPQISQIKKKKSASDWHPGDRSLRFKSSDFYLRHLRNLRISLLGFLP
jgi:hypothetical protein